MSRQLRIWIGLSLLITLLVVAVQQAIPVGGISGSGVLRGKLQRFASIVINDFELGTEQAVVHVNGVPATVQALRVGQQLTISTESIELDHADRVEYFSEAIGPISSIDPLQGRFTVLGQQVVVAGVTQFDKSDFDDLFFGRWVEVSGIRRSTSEILATYVRPLAARPRVRLSGIVGAVGADGRLVVSGFPVVVPPALVVGIRVGDKVSAEGTLAAGRTLLRSRSLVEVESIGPATANFVSQEGTVTRYAFPILEVDGVAFRLDNLTRFVNATRATVVVGDRVHVTTLARSNGASRVESVVFRPELDISAEGPLLAIEGIAPDSARVSVAGLSVLVTQGTTFGRSGNSEANARSLRDLRVGDYLKVRGSVDGAEVALTRLDRIVSREDARFDALFRSFDGAIIKAVGARIVTDRNTLFKLSGGDVTRKQFKLAIKPGDFLEVRYRDFSSPSQPAERVSLISE